MILPMDTVRVGATVPVTLHRQAEALATKHQTTIGHLIHASLRRFVADVKIDPKLANSLARDGRRKT
jgi:hypothetical protein